MTGKLLDHRYGKARVRVLKVLRAGPVHTIKELSVAVALRGDFESSFTAGSNAMVVATDTMKNTVLALAQQHLCEETEPFLLTLGRHFLDRYPQVASAELTSMERHWDRMHPGGTPHPHSFVQSRSAGSFASVLVGRDTVEQHSGLRDLLILKSAQSGFSGFPRDEYTTLPETDDRILATSLDATWKWQEALSSGYMKINERIAAALLQAFTEGFSPSVQATLFRMGEAALAAAPEIASIQLVMPNKHCLLANLAPFGLQNTNEVFIPTDEPHGQIEATIVRA